LFDLANEAQLQSVIEPVVIDLGLEFWGLEYRAGASLLRVYIDSPNGITVDDCAEVSRQLSVILDVEDPINGEYRLEVSSPGIARPLYRLAQYEPYLGNKLKVKLRSAFEDRKQFKGVLSKVDIANNEVAIVAGEDEWLIPFEMIDSANLIPQFD
jgi:ribosome maturation factor RimP